MTPGSFDLATALEMVGDAAARELSAAARKAADTGDDVPVVQIEGGGTPWDRAMWCFKQTIVDDAFAKRKARLERTKA